MMNSNERPRQPEGEASHLFKEDEEDHLASCYRHLRGALSGDGETFGTPTLFCQKEAISEWADRMGLLLDPQSVPPKLQKGGQEYDFYLKGDRVVKISLPCSPMLRFPKRFARR